MKKFLLTLLILLGLGSLTACQLNFDPVYGEHEHEITGEFGYYEQIHWNICATCDEKVDKAWHNFGPWQRVSDDSLEERRTCLCGYYESRFHSHSLTGNVLYDDNEHYEECEKCFDHVNAVAHTYGEWTVGRESTEDVQGYELQVCSCGHTVYRSLPLKNHVHVWDGTYSITEDAHWKNCVKESCTMDEVDLLVPHNGGQATCTEDAVCVDCGYHYEEAFGHTEVTDVAVAPTCTESGLTEGSHCSVCNEVLVAQQTIDALGHDYESVVTNPSCTEKGYTTHTCKKGDHTYVDSYVDALGHDYNSVVTAPTCTEDGYTTYTCKNDATHTYVGDEVAATGHTEETLEAVAPKCEATGLTEGKKCSVCDKVLVAQQTIDALGHDYESVVTNPTCTEKGYTTHTCKKGDHTYVDSYVDALGHDYESVVTNPTCTEKGYTTHTCKKGDHTYIDSYVDALGHDYESVVTNPTCTEKGYTTHTCKKGDHTYVDGYEDALGHDYEGVVTAPTCEDKGYTTYTCKNDATHTYVGDEVAATGHNYEGVVTAPTCEDKGYTTYTCKNDATHTYVSDEVAATGHNYEGVVTAPTCEDKGYTTYTCKNDATHTYVSDEVAALGHAWSDANCTTPQKCSTCGKETGVVNAEVHASNETVEKNNANDTKYMDLCYTCCGEVVDSYRIADYSYEFEAKVFVNNENKELGDEEWTLAGSYTGESPSLGYDTNNTPSKGQQFGSGNNPYSSMTLASTNKFKAYAVVVNVAGANGVEATVQVKSDNTSLKGKDGEATIAISNTSTYYTFTNEELVLGRIKIIINQTSEKAIYIKSIYVFNTKESHDDFMEEIANLNSDIESIVIPTETDTNLSLVTKCANGTDVVWQSNNEAIKIESGKGIVTRAATDVNVTLTATFSLNGHTNVKKYVVTVLAAEAEKTTYYVSKVTSSSQLIDGAKLILSYGSYAMGPQSNKIRSVIEITEIGDLTSVELPSTVQIVTLVSIGDGYYALQVADEEYLYYTSTKNEVYTKSFDALDNTAKWSIAVDANGDCTITNVAVTTRILQFNSKDPRFACYTSSQKLPLMYLVSDTPFEEEQPTEDTSVSDALAAESGTAVVLTGTVKSITSQYDTYHKNMTVVLTDGSNDIVLYRLATCVKLGDKITVTGTIATYNNTNQVAQGATAEIVESSGDLTTVTTITEVQKAQTYSPVNNLTGVVISIDYAWGGSNMSVTIADNNNNKMYLYKLGTNVAIGDVITLTSGEVVTYKGNVQIQSSTATIDTTSSIDGDLLAVYAEKEINALAATITENYSLPVTIEVLGQTLTLTWKDSEDVVVTEIVYNNPSENTLVTFSSTYTYLGIDYSYEVQFLLKSSESTSTPIDVVATFDFGANGTASHLDGSGLGSSKTYTDGEYSLNLTSMSKVYGSAYDATGNSCIKLGTSSVVGTFKFTVDDSVTKVIIYVAKYKANTTKIAVNDVNYTIETASNNGEYTAIEVDTSINKTVIFTTVTGGVRAMINTIEYYG